MLPTAFLTGIKTRKGKGKKEEERKEFFLYLSLCSFEPALFSLYGNGRPPHPAGWCRYAPQPAPLSVGEGFIFFLLRKNRNVRFTFILFSYNGKGIKEKGKKRKNKKREAKRNEKNSSRENLAGRFSYSKPLFILIRIFFLTDKRKTIF